VVSWLREIPVSHGMAAAVLAMFVLPHVTLLLQIRKSPLLENQLLSAVEALTFHPLCLNCCSDILPHTFTGSCQNYGAVK